MRARLLVSLARSLAGCTRRHVPRRHRRHARRRCTTRDQAQGHAGERGLDAHRRSRRSPATTFPVTFSLSGAGPQRRARHHGRRARCRRRARRARRRHRRRSPTTTRSGHARQRRLRRQHRRRRQPVPVERLRGGRPPARRDHGRHMDDACSATTARARATSSAAGSTRPACRCTIGARREHERSSRSRRR